MWRRGRGEGGVTPHGAGCSIPAQGSGGKLWLGQTGPEPRSSAAVTPAWTDSCAPTFLGRSPDPMVTVFGDRAFQR